MVSGKAEIGVRSIDELEVGTRKRLRETHGKGTGKAEGLLRASGNALRRGRERATACPWARRALASLACYGPRCGAAVVGM
jgi:hypothetical protein